MSARKSRTRKTMPKKQNRRTKKKVQARRDWEKTIITSAKRNQTRISMGSANSAQASRVRIMRQYYRLLGENNLSMRTEGQIIIIERDNNN